MEIGIGSIMILAGSLLGLVDIVFNVLDSVGELIAGLSFVLCFVML